MHHIKLSPFVKTNRLNHLFEDFFNIPFNELKSDFANNHPAVNVRQEADKHVIELAAPGLEKGDFDISVEKNLLTIKADKTKKDEDEKPKYSRREFDYQSFKRVFNLPKTVDTNGIDGKYENGVLYLSLPKKEEAKEVPPKTISIS